MMELLRLDWNETATQYLAWGTASEDDLKKEFAIIKGMILGYYHHFFLTENWEGVVAEREVVLDIPEGKFAIKVDAIVKEEGKYWIHDLKTVSSFSDTDKKLLNVDDQFSHYCVVAGAKFNREFEGGIRTAIKTPGIKQTQKETADKYCDRVVHDYQSRPEFYMQRIYVARPTEQLAEYRQYLYRMYQEITTNTFVFRTPSMQCGMCDYFDICVETNQDVRKAMVATDYFVRNRKHAELSISNA